MELRTQKASNLRSISRIWDTQIGKYRKSKPKNKGWTSITAPESKYSNSSKIPYHTRAWVKELFHAYSMPLDEKIIEKKKNQNYGQYAQESSKYRWKANGSIEKMDGKWMKQENG